MYVLGVDGGTTKTVALIADERGNILSAARGGGSNWAGEDVEIPMGIVSDIVRDALVKGNLNGEKISTGVFTLAGADWPEDHTRRQNVLEQAGICEKVIVKNDSFGGLRAGTNKPYGMVIAAGTGVNAAVITPDGLEWAFGYYETFGGAGTLAQDAFEAVLRAEDGRGQPTLLTPLVLKKLGFSTVEAMLRAYIVRQIQRNQFYTIPPLVFEAALASDVIAANILIRQGKGLAEYITAMVRRFHMESLEFDVVLAGSVFKGVGPLLADTIRQEIHQAAPRANIVRAQFEPVVGSVLLALDALGINGTDQLYENIRKTVPVESFFSTVNSDGLQPVYSEE